jgi:hypothetical protein
VNVIPYSFSSPKIRRSITATYRRPRRSGPARSGVPTGPGLPHQQLVGHDETGGRPVRASESPWVDWRLAHVGAWSVVVLCGQGDTAQRTQRVVPGWTCRRGLPVNGTAGTASVNGRGGTRAVYPELRVTGRPTDAPGPPVWRTATASPAPANGPRIPRHSTRPEGSDRRPIRAFPGDVTAWLP